MKILFPYSLSLLLFVLASCGSEQTDRSANDRSSRASGNGETQLTAFQLEHGIGPVTSEIDLGPIMQDRVERGRNIYQMKCEMCHSMDTRMVGPALGDVMYRRSPEFVMNMILNPGEMTNKHPEGQKMLREYMSIMPFQNVKEDEARDIVEFLRTVAPSASE